MCSYFCMDIQKLREPLGAMVTSQFEGLQASIIQPSGDLQVVSALMVILFPLSSAAWLKHVTLDLGYGYSYSSYSKQHFLSLVFKKQKKCKANKSALSWAALKMLPCERWQQLPALCLSLVLHLGVWSSRNLEWTECISTSISLQEVALNYHLTLIVGLLCVYIQNILSLCKFWFFFTTNRHKIRNEQRLTVLKIGNNTQRLWPLCLMSLLQPAQNDLVL